jgi:hypothetical protein
MLGISISLCAFFQSIKESLNLDVTINFIYAVEVNPQARAFLKRAFPRIKLFRDCKDCHGGKLVLDPVAVNMSQWH